MKDFKEEENQRLLEWSLDLQRTLQEMEDLQLKLLALQMQAQYYRDLIESKTRDIIISKTLPRD